MTIDQIRLGVLFAPTTPLWEGTVVSYAGATTFALVVATDPGYDLADIDYPAGLAVHAAGKPLRIKSINAGANTIYLAEDGTGTASGQPFEAGAAIQIYNARYLFTRYHRLVSALDVTEAGDTLNQTADWAVYGVTVDDTLYVEVGVTGAGLHFVNLYNEWDDLVARVTTAIDGVVSLTERNDSGITATVNLTYVGPDGGPSGAYKLEFSEAPFFRDYDISWDDLGIDNEARSKAEQGPVSIIEPYTINPAVGEIITIDASGSYATYNPWNGGARDPATIPAGGFTWDADGGTIHAGAGTSTITVSWPAAGFHYVRLVLADSNGTEQIRYMPVWVGITPYDIIEGPSNNWSLEAPGWTSRFALGEKITRLRYSPAAIVNMDTGELEYPGLGYIWDDTESYGPMITTSRLVFQSGLAFLRNMIAYPFELTGQKGDPIDWDNFDMLSIYRAAIFVLRWSSNYLELFNATFGTVTGTTLDDDRKVYKWAFAQGTMLSQLSDLAIAWFGALYGDIWGGFVARTHPLYLATITDAAGNAVTQDLTRQELAKVVSYERAKTMCSDAVADVLYHDADLDVFAARLRGPIAPEAWGNPAILTGLVCAAAGIYTGYQEGLIWLARHLGVLNTSDLYDFEVYTDLDLDDYYLADLPAQLYGDHSAVRVVVESKTMQFANGHYTEVLSGRTFGITATSAKETPPTIRPVDPPTQPWPPPTTTVYADGNKAVLYCDVDNGAGAYEYRIATTENLLDADPDWTLVTPPIVAAATSAERQPYPPCIAQGGDSPQGIYLSGGIVGGVGTVYYEPDIFAPTAWTGLTPPANSFFGPGGVYWKVSVPQACPDMDGRVMINVMPTNYVTGPNQRSGVYVLQEGIVDIPLTAVSIYAGTNMGWNHDNTDNVISAHINSAILYYKLNIPLDSAYNINTVLEATLEAHKIAVIPGGKNYSPGWFTSGPVRMMPVTGGMYGGGLPDTGGLGYGYDEADFPVNKSADNADWNNSINWFGREYGYCIRTPGTLVKKYATLGVGDLWVYTSYASTLTKITLPGGGGGTDFDNWCVMFGDGGTNDYYLVLQRNVDNTIAAIWLYDTATATWLDKTGAGATAINAIITESLDVAWMDVLYGDITAIS